jgi:hypothetical protein
MAAPGWQVIFTEKTPSEPNIPGTVSTQINGWMVIDPTATYAYSGNNPTVWLAVKVKLPQL